MMTKTLRAMRHSYLFLLLLSTVMPARAEGEARPAMNLPPPAELHYSIRAKQSGISIGGEASVNWQLTALNGEQKYIIQTETRASWIGKILEASSRGHVDQFGLAPEQFREKRFRRDEAVTTFDRNTKTIRFTIGDKRYPIKGGEQDRSSATWQLIATARAAGEQFAPGSEWKMMVAYTYDADPWTFKVDKRETVKTKLGDIVALHIVKVPPPNSKEQHLELWLAPSIEWYPVRIKFSDADGSFVDQTLESIKK